MLLHFLIDICSPLQCQIKVGKLAEKQAVLPGDRVAVEDDCDGLDEDGGDEVGRAEVGEDDVDGRVEERLPLPDGDEDDLEGVQRSHFGSQFAYRHFNLLIEMQIGAQMRRTVIPRLKPIEDGNTNLN